MRSVVALVLLIAGCAAETQSALDYANGINTLDEVENALHAIVSNSQLTASQLTLAKGVTASVEKTLQQVESGKKLSEKDKAQLVLGAVQKLQGLQSELELDSLQHALMKVVQSAHLSPNQLKEAQQCADDVTLTVKEVETTKGLSQQDKAKKIQGAIKELQNLQQKWEQASKKEDKLATLERELDEKKVLLKKEETELKVATLEKELAEKKVQLQRLEAMEKGAGARVAEQKDAAKETAQRQEMVEKLIASAKAMKAKNSGVHKAKSGKKDSKVGPQLEAAGKKNPALTSVLADLNARMRNVSASISKLDAAEKVEEKRLQEASNGTEASRPKSTLVLKSLLTQEKRDYMKARAQRVAELAELKDAAKSIEKGDAQSLTKLMVKMQTEEKALASKSKNFLY